MVSGKAFTQYPALYILANLTRIDTENRFEAIFKWKTFLGQTTTPDTSTDCKSSTYSVLPHAATAGNVQIDWVTIYSYQP